MIFEIFQYEFMTKAFLVGMLIAVIAPCIGVIVVLKRLSMIGDSLSHNSLAGVAAGLIAGVNPLVGAIFFTVAAALSIEGVRKAFPKYSEISIAVIMSTGIGLAGVLSGFVKNGASFSNFLFGSIVTISDFELSLVVILSLIVITVLVLLYKEFFYISFDEEAAKLAGIPVAVLNFIFVLMTAVAISISARIVGTLVISSLMVLPVAAALQIAKSYKQTLIFSVVFALLAIVSGLIVSFYGNLKPGGTIVLIGVAILLLVLLYKNVITKVLLRKTVNMDL